MADPVTSPEPAPLQEGLNGISTEPELSISEHAEQFSAEARAEAAAAETPDAPVSDPSAPPQVAEEKPRGVRHRAQSAKPGVLIPQLKADLKAAQEELSRLKSERASAPQIAAAQTEVQQAHAQVVQAQPRFIDPSDPEPQETDPKFNGDWMAYQNDRVRWAARDEYRQIQAREMQQQAQYQRVRSFADRVDASKSKHADYEQVAFAPFPVTPAQDPIVDSFIMEDDMGAEILYHLQSQPQERDALLRLSGLAKAKALSQLSLRLASSSLEPAGTHGAVAQRTIALPHPPPTPLRTEAQRMRGTPPPTDGSLSIAEHLRSFGKKTH